MIGPLERVAMCLLAVALTVASLLHKLSCTGPSDPSVAAITRITRTACYSDVASLFGIRELGRHLFPYVHGTYTADPPAVHGGTVEYPTLTGMWVWLSALPVSSAEGFLVVTALTFLPAVVVTTLLLQRLAGRRAWVFAATPPLFLYALYNWDLLPVLMTTVGLWLALAGPRRCSPTTRAVLAGAAFGLGGAFKLYPVMFVAPLALSALLDAGGTDRWRRAAGAVGAAVGAVLVANVPFALVDPEGWASVFRFQAARDIDPSTLSVWYWAFLPWSSVGNERAQALMGVAATASTALGLATVLLVAVVIGRRTARLPWVGTAAAMLAVYMLCNKVDSLQYTLWLLPFFVVLPVRAGWIAAYLAVDLAAFAGWYRWIYYHSLGNQDVTWADQALTVGVFGRAALLLGLGVAFLVSSVRGAPADGPAETSPTAVRSTAADDRCPRPA